MEKHVVRTGIIGCGGMGRAHVGAVEKHPQFQLVAACDTNPDALAALPEHVRKYAEAKSLFGETELDLVSIIVPNHLYNPMVRLAAEHGVSVFCEKPLGKGLADCREIASCLRDAGLGGWVSGQRKYLSHILRAKEKVAQLKPDFIAGQFTYSWGHAYGDPRWRGDREKSGGVAVIDSGWHVLDLLSWFVGDPAEACAELRFLERHPGIDDKADIRLRYDGAAATLLISYTWPVNRFEFTIAKGGKVVHFDLDEYICSENGEVVEQYAKQSDDDAFLTMYGELHKALNGNREAYVTELGRAEAIMHAVDACYRSAESRTWVAC